MWTCKEGGDTVVMTGLKVERHRFERPDGSVFYRRAGHGTPVVFLHAAPQAGWSFDTVLPAFARDFFCFVIDLPGFDHSDTPPRSYTIDDFTDSVLDLMDHAGINKTHIIGSHTGAVVGMNLAAREPDRVDKLVVEDSPGWNRQEGMIIFEKFFKPGYDENGLPQPVPLEQALRRNPEIDREKHERQNQIIAANPAWIRVCHEANTSFDVQAIMPKVKAPTLVIFEEADPLRRREQRFVEEIPDARLVVIPGANDEAHYHKPEEFTREVLAFFEN